MFDLKVSNQMTQICLCSLTTSERKIVDSNAGDCRKIIAWPYIRWYTTDNKALSSQSLRINIIR